MLSFPQSRFWLVLFVPPVCSFCTADSKGSFFVIIHTHLHLPALGLSISLASPSASPDMTSHLFTACFKDNIHPLVGEYVLYVQILKLYLSKTTD